MGFRVQGLGFVSVAGALATSSGIVSIRGSTPGINPFLALDLFRFALCVPKGKESWDQSVRPLLPFLGLLERVLGFLGPIWGKFWDFANFVFLKPILSFWNQF